MSEELVRKLAELARQSRALEEELARPETIASPQYVELSQKYARLKEAAEAYRALEELDRHIAETEQLQSGERDAGMLELIREELESKRRERDALLLEVKEILVPEEPQDAKGAIIEIRGGTGGEESALFAADLLRMYSRYAERKGLKIDLMDAHPTPLGGFKNIVFAASGRGAYGHFKFEGGVHRVQRVPKTEAAGRVHTSTATVAVLPEVEPLEVGIKESDLEIEAFRASGPGGQNVNKVSSAVRIKHLPSGIVVACQEERSQHKNKEKALRLLRAQLKAGIEEKAEQKRASTRRILIGSAARSEKIRTYNFPQNRVTDHRIELTVYRLEEILDGTLDLIVEPLIAAYREEQLAAVAFG
jgi:peptide chain release factor 1